MLGFAAAHHQPTFKGSGNTFIFKISIFVLLLISKLIFSSERAMKQLKTILSYLKDNHLTLTTAESCTAGRIIHLLGRIAGSGACLDAGYVVYSSKAKKKLLSVKQATIDKYTLTSEEVAREMTEGALKIGNANIVIATTGVAGPEPMDGIPKGTICFGWGIQVNKKTIVYTKTKHFDGTRIQIVTRAAEYALLQIPHYHQKFLNEV